jgi:hypothetical protein
MDVSATGKSGDKEGFALAKVFETVDQYERRKCHGT